MKAWIPWAALAVLASVGFAMKFSPRDEALPAPVASGPVQASAGEVQGFPFVDPEGHTQSLAQFAGQIVVLNFWATWCAPCTAEMPGFVRLQARWAERGVQFVGIANDEPAAVAQFGRELKINYPLWIGGSTATDLSRRLGNRLGVLPHTVILDARGVALESRIGIYAESALDSRLREIAPRT